MSCSAFGTMGPSVRPAEEQGLIGDVRQNVEDVLRLDLDLQAWCTDLCISRYLAARSQDVENASKMLRKTLQWRLKVCSWVCYEFLGAFSMLCHHIAGSGSRPRPPQVMGLYCP